MNGDLLGEHERSKMHLDKLGGSSTPSASLRSGSGAAPPLEEFDTAYFGLASDSDDELPVGDGGGGGKTSTQSGGEHPPGDLRAADAAGQRGAAREHAAFSAPARAAARRKHDFFHFFRHHELNHCLEVRHPATAGAATCLQLPATADAATVFLQLPSLPVRVGTAFLACNGLSQPATSP